MQVIENNLMTPEQFVYWLQGYSEVSGEQPTKEQWQVIQDHLKEVFDKNTPERIIYTTSSPQTTGDPIDFGQTKFIC